MTARVGDQIDILRFRFSIAALRLDEPFYLGCPPCARCSDGALARAQVSAFDVERDDDGERPPKAPAARAEGAKSHAGRLTPTAS
jgi:hypothetical protein